MNFHIAQFAAGDDFGNTSKRVLVTDAPLDDGLQTQIITEEDGIWLRVGPDAGSYENGVVIGLGCNHLQHTFTQVASPGGLRDLAHALIFLAGKLEEQ